MKILLRNVRMPDLSAIQHWSRKKSVRITVSLDVHIKGNKEDQPLKHYIYQTRNKQLHKYLTNTSKPQLSTPNISLTKL